jgi:tyrosinase
MEMKGKMPGRRRMVHTSIEPMVSFAEMLRMLDEEILEIIKLPPGWFPLVYDRKDQASLSPSEQERFLCAYDTLVGSGTLGQFVKIHGETHFQHGSERFLPWHRVYLILLEQALKAVHPDVSIPYWDWTNASEQSFPTWLTSVKPTVPMPSPMTPITVTRFPGTSADLATIVGNVPNVMAQSTFSSFTGSLEGVHGMVHVWVGGTMSMIPTAPADPIFWMHHCNIDRLWWQWQQGNAGLYPNLPGPPATSTSQVMDPWSYTEADTRNITDLGYAYA